MAERADHYADFASPALATASHGNPWERNPVRCTECLNLHTTQLQAPGVALHITLRPIP